MTHPAGWYPDANGTQRWWDGQQWATPPAPGPSPMPPPAPKGHRTRNIVLTIVGVIVIAGVIGGIAGGKSKPKAAGSSTIPSGTPTTSTTSTSPAKPKSSTHSVSSGIGSSKAAKDITLGKLTTGGDLALTSVKVTITNHSKGRSDYVVTVALESADGKQQIDTGDAFVTNLEAGQSSVQEVDFFSAPDKLPAGAKVVLQEVERTASI